MSHNGQFSEISVEGSGISDHFTSPQKKRTRDSRIRGLSEPPSLAISYHPSRRFSASAITENFDNDEEQHQHQNPRSNFDLLTSVALNLELDSTSSSQNKNIPSSRASYPPCHTSSLQPNYHQMHAPQYNSNLYNNGGYNNNNSNDVGYDDSGNMYNVSNNISSNGSYYTNENSNSNSSVYNSYNNTNFNNSFTSNINNYSISNPPTSRSKTSSFSSSSSSPPHSKVKTKVMRINENIAAATDRSRLNIKTNAFLKASQSVGMPPTVKKRNNGGVLEAFPSKLYRLLNEVDPNIIAWHADGLSFLMKDRERFKNEVMPLYFKQGSITSFQRQINLYNFKNRLTSGAPEYYHEEFQRENEMLVSNMKRSKIKGTGQARVPNNNNITPPATQTFSAVDSARGHGKGSGGVSCDGEDETGEVCVYEDNGENLAEEEEEEEEEEEKESRKMGVIEENEGDL